MKTIGIMQPYFLPYIGYFQLINMVDEFVIYDNIKFTKKGWINRNRMLQNGKAVYFSIPIKKDSDFLNIDERVLANIFFSKEKDKLLRVIKSNYKKTPYFNDFFPCIEKILNYNNRNLFQFVFHSIQVLNEYLNIGTKLVVSSTLGQEIKTLKSQEKVIEICKVMNANKYINSIGGRELYQKEIFKENGIDLIFYKPDEIKYNQFKNDFVPNLSVLDLCMFNHKEKLKIYLDNYEII